MTAHPLDIESAELIATQLDALADEFDLGIAAARSGDLDPQEWMLVWGDLLDNLGTVMGSAKRAHLEASLPAAHFRVEVARDFLNRAARASQ